MATKKSTVKKKAIKKSVPRKITAAKKLIRKSTPKKSSVKKVVVTKKASSSRTKSPALSIAKLRSSFPGRVIAPKDPDYDKARTVFYGGVDRHPGVIIRVTDAKEVAQVIALARETGLE